MPRLLVLAVLLCCSLLCKPLLALEECPCWAEPDSTTGECSDKQLPLVYSSREFAETYTQCVDRVTYDAEYGEWVAWKLVRGELADMNALGRTEALA
eukprot:281034-Pelagomonas_calceolata.AAC.7